MALEVRTQRILQQQPLQPLLDHLPQVLGGGPLGWALLEFLPEPLEVDLADVVRLGRLTHMFRHRLNRLIDNLVELPNDVGDVRLLPVLLEAHIDDVDRVPVCPVSVHAVGVDASLELLEDFSTHHLETLAGLVVLVGRFLAGHDGCVPGEAGFLDHVVQGCVPAVQEPSHQHDRFGQLGQQFCIRPRGIGLAALAIALRAGEGR